MTQNTERTAKEWFELLKEPYRSQAIKASEEQPYYSSKKEKYESLHDALMKDFNFLITRNEMQWYAVIDSIYKGETTYLADQPSDDEWIKCSERLPDIEDKYYLAGSVQSKDVERVWYYGDGKWGVRHNPCNEITHWRELPNPPKA